MARFLVLTVMPALLLSLTMGCASSSSVPRGLVLSIEGAVSGVNVEEVACEAKTELLKTTTDTAGRFHARSKWLGVPASVLLNKTGYFDAVCSLDGRNSRYILWPKNPESPKFEPSMPDEYVNSRAGSSVDLTSADYFTTLSVAFEKKEAIRGSMIKNWERLERRYDLALMLSIFGEGEDFDFLRSAALEEKRGKFIREKMLLNTLLNPVSEQE